MSREEWQDATNAVNADHGSYQPLHAGPHQAPCCLWLFPTPPTASPCIKGCSIRPPKQYLVGLEVQRYTEVRSMVGGFKMILCLKPYKWG